MKSDNSMRILMESFKTPRYRLAYNSRTVKYHYIYVQLILISSWYSNKAFSKWMTLCTDRTSHCALSLLLPETQSNRLLKRASLIWPPFCITIIFTTTQERKSILAWYIFIVPFCAF